MALNLMTAAVFGSDLMAALAFQLLAEDCSLHWSHDLPTDPAHIPTMSYDFSDLQLSFLNEVGLQKKGYHNHVIPFTSCTI